MSDGGARPARVTIRRVVEWPDTDAAGRYHHSTVIRWVEAAEGELHAALDLLDLFGFVPRVHYEVDYFAPLFFRDEVEVDLRVDSVGSTSVSYAFSVSRGSELAAKGEMVAVQLDGEVTAPQPWSENTRKLLLTAGAV
ncbi:MAG: acyl-CoA thioesterase [Nocardioidaceae bacterium]